MQVNPIKPLLKAPGTKRLKLECDILLSDSASKLNLRRYIKLWRASDGKCLLTTTKVGRCRLNLSNPR